MRGTRLPVESILRKNGMIGMLVELMEGNKTFTQIRSALRLSMSTVLTRLREAEAYELIERTVGTTGKSRIEVKYKLTSKGQTLIENLLGNERINQLLNECRSLKKEAYKVEEELMQLLSQTDLRRFIS